MYFFCVINNRKDYVGPSDISSTYRVNKHKSICVYFNVWTIFKILKASLSNTIKRNECLYVIRV